MNMSIVGYCAHTAIIYSVFLCLFNWVWTSGNVLEECPLKWSVGEKFNHPKYYVAEESDPGKANMFDQGQTDKLGYQRLVVIPMVLQCIQGINIYYRCWKFC